MNIEFYSCYSCGNTDELQIWLKNIKCSCGSKRLNPAYLSPVRLWLYVLFHPSYFIKALKEAK